MWRLVLGVLVAGIVAMTSQASAAVVTFGDGGAALQGVFDGITTVPVGGPSSITVATDGLIDTDDTLWSLSGTGGSVETIVVELASFANTNTFGIYDAADWTNSVEIFKGTDVAGDSKTIQILGDGSVTVFNTGGTTATGTFQANKFGFYLNTDQLGGQRYYSDTSLNSDGFDHMAAFQGEGDSVVLPGLFAGVVGPEHYFLAWEDLLNGGDRDFTDFVVLAESVNPVVPEPASIVVWSLLGMASVGVSVFRRRRRGAA